MPALLACIRIAISDTVSHKQDTCVIMPGIFKGKPLFYITFYHTAIYPACCLYSVILMLVYFGKCRGLSNRSFFRGKLIYSYIIVKITIEGRYEKININCIIIFSTCFC